jgi:RNA polymerase primary sigma factor/RNA polymerase sigma factor
MQFPLEYMPSAEFTASDAAQRILGPMPPALRAPRKTRRPAGVPGYLASLYDTPLLTAEQERYLFRKYNYLKYQASMLRNEMDPARPSLQLLIQIEELNRQAVETKNQIIRANLRLVVSIAKKYASRREDFFEIVSAGNVSLMKAIEKFDYTRGFKLSTYATWAIKQNFAREYVTTARHSDRYRTSQDERLDLTADERSDRYAEERQQAQRAVQVNKILGSLTERERKVIRLRFGLGVLEQGKTLKEVGSDFGVSKERIRQLEHRALAKLRNAAVLEKFEEF